MEKFLGVDVLDTLHTIAKQTLINGWDNFAWDKDDITKIARYQSPTRSALLWICHADGTALYPESNTFVRGAAAYKDVQFYQSDERSARVSAYYAIEISGERRGIVRGNVYAVDSRRYAALVKDAMPICSTEAEIVSAREAALEQTRRTRKALPVGNITTHVEKLIQMQINSEADRMTAIIQKMDRPNDLRGTYHMAAVSNQFLAKASREDIDKLIDILRENLQSPSLFLGAIGDGKTRCVFQHRDEHSQTKPSIRGQLAAAKEAQAEQPTVQRHQKDKEAR